MPTEYEEFWTHSSFAFVGHSAKKAFPKLSYGELKKQGKQVFPVDPSVDEIEGDRTYPDLDSLPGKVDAVVLELPREETEDWVRKAADAGIQNLWIHMTRETPEAVALARERGLKLLTGSCAVMYVKPGFSYHSLHKWINRLMGKY
jgi:predicted CoA-binding protein